MCTRWASLSRAQVRDAGIARLLILNLFRRGLPLLAVDCLVSGYYFRYAVPGRSTSNFHAYSLSL